LLKWQLAEKLKPLILRGARQVGNFTTWAPSWPEKFAPRDNAIRILIMIVVHQFWSCTSILSMDLNLLILMGLS